MDLFHFLLHLLRYDFRVCFAIPLGVRPHGQRQDLLLQTGNQHDHRAYYYESQLVIRTSQDR